MSQPSLKEKTAKGLFWGGFSNGMQQLLNLAFGIFLARMLDRSDYGMVGLLTVFSAVASALQEGGFISALTNRKEAAHRDFNAVFWFSTLCSVVFYLILFFSAPLIAGFYRLPELVPLSRLLFLSIVISAIGIAPRAYLFKHLMVRETTVISVSALCVSGVTGILLAANGFAYRGLAIQSLAYVGVVTLLSFRFARWHPCLPADLRPIHSMIGFGSRLVVTNIANVVNNNLFPIILGKYYSAHEVGDFTQANKWNDMGHTLVTNMINGIAQPVFTSISDDRGRQLAVFRKLLRFTAFVSFPAMFGLSLVARELIVIALTAKWLPSACILQLLCVWGAFIPVASLFSNLIVSRGHSSVYMWNTLGICLLQLAVACVLHPFGLQWMLRAFVAVNVGWLFVWFHFVHREIGLTLKGMLRDVAPYLCLSAVLAAGTHWLASSIGNPWLALVLKAGIMGAGYVLALWWMKSVIFRECVRFLLKRKAA